MSNDQIIKLLQEIVHNTRPKQSLQLIVAGNKSEIIDNYSTPLKLNPKSQYEIALVNLETWHSFPNIDKSNNKLKYSNDNGVTWHVLYIPEGCYELDELDKEIERQLKLKKHLVNIKLTSNTSTLKSIMEISGNFKVDFREPESINRILGFKEKVYHAGYNESENNVNILSVNSIFVELNIINGSYVKGKRKAIIYSFFPEVSPGYKIVETPRNLVYLPVNTNEISSIEVKLTDQNGKLLNLRGEDVTIRFHLREL